MIGKPVLIDTGPLVALLNERDAAHSLCADSIRNEPLPMVTSWLVITEAAWLLRKIDQGVVRLLELITSGVIECAPLDLNATERFIQYANKYADLKPQLADLSLLYLAEQRDIAVVLTLDRRDFLVYRTSTGKSLTLIPAVVPNDQQNK